MESMIIRYEELAMNAFPALLTEVYDGWILRYSNGYTYRGNSINPVYKSTVDLTKKVKACEERYFKKSLPCVFKMTMEAEDGLDHLLEDRGYKIEKEADIMELSLKGLQNWDKPEVVCENSIDKQWLEEFLVLNGTTKEPVKSTAKEMLLHIGNEVLCAAIYQNGEMAACGLGVYEDGKIGLYDIRVKEEHRRKGYGTMICKKIIHEGIKMGAKTAYLQVASLNDPAIRMYRKMGFQKIYTYWYRVLHSMNKDLGGVGYEAEGEK